MTNVFIFHGTNSHPEDNWFPWLKQDLESFIGQPFNCNDLWVKLEDGQQLAQYL